jgi:cell division protein FtsZ
VVATGIEQTAEMAQEAARPFNLGVSRGPARPSDEPEKIEPLFSREEPVAAPVVPSAYEPEVAEAPADEVPEAVEAEADDDGIELELGEFEEASEESAAAVDGDDDDSALTLEAPVEPVATESSVGNDDLLSSATRLAEEDDQVSPLVTRKRPLVSSSSGEDEGERTPRLAGAGSTLFERMANLSRGGSAKDEGEEEEEDGGDEAPSISIPRFLGRQNNQ